MKKKLLRWGIWISLAIILIILAGVLSLDTIAKLVAQKRLRAETGMETHIGKFSIGLNSSSIHIENLVLKNPPEFGGDTFVNMPELFLEYDREALRAGKLSIKLVRINIAEMHIIENKAGKKNIDGLQKQKARLDLPSHSESASEKGAVTKPAFAFDGIDLLDVSLDSVKFTSEKNPDQNLDLHFGSEHELFKNLKTDLDFQTAGLVLCLKAGLSGSLDFQSLFHRPAKTIKKSKRAVKNVTEPLQLNSTNP